MRLALAPLLLVAACSAAGRRIDTDTDLGQPDGATCTGLRCLDVTCAAGATTSVSGRVTAPNGRDPIAGALVYVADTLSDFPATVSCEVCDDPLAALPIVTTKTAVDGTFTLTEVPVSESVPITIQKGRFRRTVPVPVVACRDNPLAANVTRLPSSSDEGDLPHIAVGVGDYDQIECVLRSFGIADSEFNTSPTGPSAPGAVHLYDNGGGLTGGHVTPFTTLLGSAGDLAAYNMVFVNCTGNLFAGVPANGRIKTVLEGYVHAGGRLYVTDWAYDYLEQVTAFAPYLYFAGGGDHILPQPPAAAQLGRNTANIAATVSDPDLAAWLLAAGVTTAAAPASVDVTDLLGGFVLLDPDALAPAPTNYPAQSWVHGTTNGDDRPLTATFDYQGCGKVLYSSYHTRSPGGSGAANPFPGYCVSDPTTMIAQEKILEYLILEILELRRRANQLK